MQLTDQALDISRAQAQAAGQAASPTSTCIGIMLDASAASAKSSAKRNAADACSAAAKKCALRPRKRSKPRRRAAP